MTTDGWIFTLLMLVGLPLVLFWVYKKRNRLFFQTKYTAETVMMNFQDEYKRGAMEAVEYMNEEAEEDEAGEGK